MTERKKVLVCGGTGFIGSNMVRYLLSHSGFELYATHHQTRPPREIENHPGIRWVRANLADKADVDRVMADMDIVIQAAATTSGAKDIVNKPYLHVTDNAVMNSLIFRFCFEHRVRQVVFFICTTMYREQETPVKESDFHYEIIDKYFGSSWTKVYIEKMCEFYSGIGETRYTVIRHSNIYGPHDKYDLEKSHVFGATVTKVMTAPEHGKLNVWGDGSDERDLLYMDDLVAFVAIALERQKTPFELVNVGAGTSIAVRDLVSKIIQKSGRHLSIEFDRTKPSIGFKLAINIDKAQKLFDWSPRVSLDEGIEKTLAWYRSSGMPVVVS